MTVKFINNDPGYLNWISQHPLGFVLNTTKSESSSYLVLHRSPCPLISDLTSQMKTGAFTARKYIKACATSISSLQKWARQSIGRGIKRVCDNCKPTKKAGGKLSQSRLSLIEDTARTL